MNRSRIIQLVCLLLAAAAIGLGAWMQEPINQIRLDEGLEIGVADENDRIEIGEFPELTLLQAMPGGLRSLVIDYMWIRSQELKNEGRLYDAHQRAEMICRLQPYFPQVWSFMAWDLAWNMSVKYQTPEERWRKVYAGVELLRDQGIPYNPRAVVLYQQLAWIYFSKMGGLMDDHHMYYKRRTAGIFHAVLGAPPQSGDPGEVEAWMQAIADAPTGEDVLLSAPAVAEFVARARALGLDLDQTMLDAYRTWSDDVGSRMLGETQGVPATERHEQLLVLMTASADASARDRVIAYCRSRVLRDQFHMDPDWMLRTIRTYGPVDFRLVWAHGLYWASLGKARSERENGSMVDWFNNYRNVTNSLRDLYFQGTLMVAHNERYPEAPAITMLPNYHFVEPTHRAYMASALLDPDSEQARQFQAEQDRPEDPFAEFASSYQQVQDPQDAPTEALRQFKSGHINFLADAIKSLVASGQEDQIAQAQQYYNYLKDTYEPQGPEWTFDDVEQFAFYRVNTVAGGVRRQIMPAMIGRVVETALLHLLQDDAEAFNRGLERARVWHGRFQAQATNNRVRLDPFEQLVGSAIFRLLINMPVREASDIYLRLGPWQAEIWDALQPVAERTVAAFNRRVEQYNENRPVDAPARPTIDLASAFPPPPETLLEQVRQRRAAQRLEQSEAEIMLPEED